MKFFLERGAASYAHRACKFNCRENTSQARSFPVAVSAQATSIWTHSRANKFLVKSLSQQFPVAVPAQAASIYFFIFLFLKFKPIPLES